MVLGIAASFLSCTHSASRSTHSQPAVAGPRSQPVPVIIDTDIGGDIDDTWILAMLLMRPEVDVRLIVTDRDNTPAKTRLVAKILTRLDRTDVPIGTRVSIRYRRPDTGFSGDFTLQRR